MNKIEYAKLVDKIIEELKLTTKQGQAEYAHASDNVFDNFIRVGAGLDIPPDKVLMVYAGKHWDGINSYIKGYTSQREDVRGRIKDLIVYMMLLWGMVDEEWKEIDKIHTPEGRQVQKDQWEAVTANQSNKTNIHTAPAPPKQGDVRYNTPRGWE